MILHDSVMQRLQRVAAWDEKNIHQPRRLFYMIEITQCCSLECPICYADSTNNPSLHKPVNEILELGKKIRTDGGRIVQLIGGEPTDHPRLMEIITGLKKMGLRPLMATNGIRLSSQPTFATTLRRSGLYKVNIQFDTLDAATSIVMRGRDLIAEKKAAISNSIKAGLRVGIVTTVCDRNVCEVQDILNFAISFMPGLNTLTFQTLITGGRFLPDVHFVDRATIFSHLLSSDGYNHGLSVKDIMPPPQYAPWRALTHPSCASFLFVCRNHETSATWPLNRDVDMEQVYASLHTSDKTRSGIINSIIYPAFILWRASRKGARIQTLRRMLSLATGRGKDELCAVYVDGLMDQHDLDSVRIQRCPACFVSEQGFRSPCDCYSAPTKKERLKS